MPRHLLFPFVLMLVQATVFGSTFSINKLAATAGVPPFAYSFWQSLGSAALLAIVVHVRGDRVGMTWAHLKSYVVIGGIGIGIPTALLTVVAPKLPAVALTLGLALTPSFTYAASLIIGIEKFRALGVGGWLIGFAGVTIVVGPGNVLDQPGSWAWYILGLSGPLMFAICILLAGCVTSEVVYLKNANGEMVQCGPFTTYGLIVGPIMNRDKMRDCTSDYQRQGSTQQATNP